MKLKLYYLLILFSIIAVKRSGKKQKMKEFSNDKYYLKSGSSESLSRRDETLIANTIIKAGNIDFPRLLFFYENQMQTIIN